MARPTQSAKRHRVPARLRGEVTAESEHVRPLAEQCVWLPGIRRARTRCKLLAGALKTFQMRTRPITDGRRVLRCVLREVAGDLFGSQRPARVVGPPAITNDAH